MAKFLEQIRWHNKWKIPNGFFFFIRKQNSERNKLIGKKRQCMSLCFQVPNAPESPHVAGLFCVYSMSPNICSSAFNFIFHHSIVYLKPLNLRKHV